MSDYMFMLENHLSSEQNRAVAEVQKAAAEAGVNLFLTGGGMRDVLGGFQVRDLDFSVEGNALKVAASLASLSGVRMLTEDENRRLTEFVFPGGVTVQVSMSRVEKYPKIGGKPRVTPATIQEDLRGRDFTINAIALSLNRASRGLLLDPTNGLADLERRELRMLGSSTFSDDPVRMLRLVRLRVRLGFSVGERTAQSFENAREARYQKYITPQVLLDELKKIALEPGLGEVVQGLEQHGLMTVFSPVLTGAKVNGAGLMRLERALHLFPPGMPVEKLGPFLYALTGKLTPREKTELVKATAMPKSDVDLWQKLETRSRRLETLLKSARIRKPSQVYQALIGAATDELLFLLCHSPYKPVQERIRNYLQKYIPQVQEIPAAELEPADARPGTPRYEKARQTLLALHLDRRTRHSPTLLSSSPTITLPVSPKGRATA
jgi:tRNA nucleotidyltransferase/poly(A) polymerase